MRVIFEAYNRLRQQMRITDAQKDDASLSAIGVEVCNLLLKGEMKELTSRFGYALAFDRDRAVAVSEDLAASLVELGAATLSSGCTTTPVVKYFQPNSTGLVAAVECLVGTDNGKSLLVELVVTSDRNETHVTLEQLSSLV